MPSKGKQGALPPTFVTTNSVTLLARRVHLYLTEEDRERISGMLTCKGEDGDDSGEWGSKWGEMDLRGVLGRAEFVGVRDDAGGRGGAEVRGRGHSVEG